MKKIFVSVISIIMLLSVLQVGAAELESGVTGNVEEKEGSHLISFDAYAKDYEYFPFIHSEEPGFEWRRMIIGDGDYVPGYLYTVNTRTHEAIQILDMPVQKFTHTDDESTLFCVVNSNQIIQTDFEASYANIFYTAEYGPLGNLYILDGKLYCADGISLICIDLSSMEVRNLLCCEGVQSSYPISEDSIEWSDDCSTYLYNVNTNVLDEVDLEWIDDCSSTCSYDVNANVLDEADLGEQFQESDAEITVSYDVNTNVLDEADLGEQFQESDAEITVSYDVNANVLDEVDLGEQFQVSDAEITVGIEPAALDEPAQEGVPISEYPVGSYFTYVWILAAVLGGIFILYRVPFAGSKQGVPISEYSVGSYFPYVWILAAVLGGILILYCVSFAESEQALPGDIEEQDVVLSDDDYFSDAESEQALPGDVEEQDVVLSDDDYFSDAESEQVLPWDIEEQTVVLSYDDYFSDVREYDGNDITFGWERRNYFIQYEEPHISLHNWVRDEFLWDIADIDGCNWFTLGEQWIYCVVNQTTLLRMDYWGENREILFVDETGLLGKYAEVRTRHCLFKDETLFFIAGSKDKLGIYRIYLPTRTVDVMYDEIPLTAINLDLNKPVSNHEITWTDGNPEFFAFYESLSSDWSSLHEDTPYNSDEAIGMVELDYRIYSAREHYINTATNTYKEIPFGYVYLPKPRSDENVELNGEAWWKDE